MRNFVFLRKKSANNEKKGQITSAASMFMKDICVNTQNFSS